MFVEVVLSKRPVDKNRLCDNQMGFVGVVIWLKDQCILITEKLCKSNLFVVVLSLERLNFAKLTWTTGLLTIIIIAVE